MDFEKKIKDLQDQIDELRVKRIHEHDILPGEVKSKHISEGPKWVRSGLAANRPTSGEDSDNGSAIYFATDTDVLSIWNGTAWKSYTLIPTTPSAYTQTYSTAARTVPNATSTDPPAGGTGATEGAYDTAAHRDAMITSLTNANADILALKKVVTALIDDLQAVGLIA